MVGFYKQDACRTYKAGMFWEHFKIGGAWLAFLSKDDSRTFRTGMVVSGFLTSRMFVEYLK